MWSGGFSTGRQALGGIEVGGNRSGFGFSSPGRIYDHHYESRAINNRGPPRKSPGKRAASEAYPPSPPIPKLSTQPNHPRIPPIMPSPIPMHNRLRQLFQEHPDSVPVAKLPDGLKSLSPEEIFRLDAIHEGQLKVDGVSPEEMRRWETEYPGVLENDNIRQEYNFLNGRFIIQCSTSPTHEALAQFFTACVSGSLNERFGMMQAMSLVRVGSGMSMQSISLL